MLIKLLLAIIDVTNKENSYLLYDRRDCLNKDKK